MSSRSMPRQPYMVAIVFLTFFVMSLLTNILGARSYRHHQQLQSESLAAAALAFFLVLHRVLSAVELRRAFWWNASVRNPS